jgi:hypothetical protein
MYLTFIYSSLAPDNPFGNGSPQMASYSQQGSPANLQPAQVFASMTGNQNNMTPPQQSKAREGQGWSKCLADRLFLSFFL